MKRDRQGQFRVLQRERRYLRMIFLALLLPLVRRRIPTGL